MKWEKATFVVLTLLITFLFGGVANATDTLMIDNNLDGSIPRLRVQHKVGASEGYNSSEDATYVTPPSGNAGIYSDIITNKLSKDARPIDSNTPFDIKLVFNGTPSDPTNFIHFGFGTEYFGTKPIIFESDRVPYGPVVDVRKAINQNSGNLPLFDAPGSHTLSTPYGTGVLEIGTRLLADLNDSNEVDFKDFSLFAKDWQKGLGQYVADICGPNGIPDGYVDNYDLAAFCEDWLKDINVPSTW